MKKETVILGPGYSYWYTLSPERLEEIRRHDAETGNTMDSSGESRIYCATRSGTIQEPTMATVTRRRNIPWDSFRTKPTRLVEGLANIDGVPQLIMFRMPKTN